MEVILLVIPFVTAALGNVLHSTSNTLSGICDDLVLSLQLLNRNELLRLVDAEKCGNYKLLGDAVLRVVDKQDRYCYSDLAHILCHLKFAPYEANFNCDFIRDKFTTILRHCLLPEEQVAQRNCSNINSEQLTIDDPLEFYARSPTSFAGVELDYCAKMADSFNLCQSLAKKLNYQKLCLDGGFQSYCSHYVQAMCRNFVLPYIMGRLLESKNSPIAGACRDAGKLIGDALLDARDNLMAQGQRNSDVLDSKLAYKSWLQQAHSDVAKMNGLMAQISSYAQSCYRRSFNIFGTPYNFDSLIKAEWYRALQLSRALLDSCKRLPTNDRDTTSLIRDYDRISQAQTKLKETLISFKQLYSLIMSTSHSSNMATGAFGPIPRDLLDKTINVTNEVQGELSQRVSKINASVSTAESSPEDLGVMQDYHNQANELRFIATLHEAQTSALYRQLVKSRETNFAKATRSM